MRFLVDVNLSPSWCEALRVEGWESVHWSVVGNPGATDTQVMAWAAREGYIVLTNDLDFGAILSATRSKSPSVVQFRTQDLRPARLGPVIVPILKQTEPELTAGALIVID